MDAVAFQRKWIGVTLKERSASQEHFLDLCRVLDVPTPATADPTGESYTFERGAGKAGGGDGWADVWYRGHFAWEYKGKKANLNRAYLQLLQYKDDLENPPLLIVCDLNIIEIHTNFTDTVKNVSIIDLANFAENSSQDILRRVFHDPLSLKPGKTREMVTAEAAQSFSRIAVGMHTRGVAPATAAHFLVQLLFCLFAEDVGLLPNKVFSKMVDAGLRRPESFGQRARELLQVMNTGGDVAYEDIPRFNGGLFRTVDAQDLTRAEIEILHDAATLDWSAIEPAIFGTLFERSLDPGKRAQLGAHYTGRADIDRVVEPVVMQPLLRRWAEIRTEADAIRQRWLDAKTPQTQKNRRDDFAAKLAGFIEELNHIRILDPACGSGNFLYVALDRLLTLEKDVMTYGANAGLPMGFPSIRPTQVLGLELNEYAQELAQVAIWIGYLQWMISNGFSGISEPVLDPLETIRLQDALLDFSGDEVKETVWPDADFIIGNPPFLGNYRMRGELGDKYVDQLYSIFRTRVRNKADLCCYFFEKARFLIDEGTTKRAGLLATNSIRGGANREVLDRIKASGDIFCAWSDEPWILNGAAVRISIVGFDSGSESLRQLNGNPVVSINSDLSLTDADITTAQVLKENTNVGFKGVEKGGPFEISDGIAQSFLRLPQNVNGKTNDDVVKRWRNGIDIVRRPLNQWIVDFGVDMGESEAAMYEEPYRFVLETVKPRRIGNREVSREQSWWVHARPRQGMRSALATLDRYLVTPHVSKYRVFVWLDNSILPGNLLIAFAREDDYFFGVLHSRAHEVWSLRMGTWLGKGNDPRYTPTTCFETFPFPWAPGTEPTDDPRVMAIGDAAKRLNELRENWLNPPDASPADLKKRTLTNLYNQRPQWLINTHATLDRAVWAAYGWDDPDPATVEEDTLLSRLLALNQERAAAQ